ncbi:MAG: SOS response-associated peptidase family protein [Dermatophilaceae bacterium]
MCGRYALAPSSKQKSEQLRRCETTRHVENPLQHRAYPIGICHCQRPPCSEFSEMNWGLVPSWSRDGVNSGKLINARAESIFEKPSFREVIQTRRCLVPADSFYEWRKEPDGRKLPYRILLKNGALMFMAGDLGYLGLRSKRTDHLLNYHNRPQRRNGSPAQPDAADTCFERETQETGFPTMPAGKNNRRCLQPPANGLLRMYRVSERLERH